MLEVVTAVSHKPGLRRLAPMAFVRFRIDGKDWPASPLPSLRMRTTLGIAHWQLEGRIDGRDVLIRVDQPAERCVSLQYTDPDGGKRCAPTPNGPTSTSKSAATGSSSAAGRCWEPGTLKSACAIPAMPRRRPSMNVDERR
ncbi:hypothetical protein I551_7438 [Mycobacterium ulcerans str. Harvey]|uniref:Uncharacterized protein n=1 Tax=Mycobacterium ulcerans str. Harvey TaxID=1299332 RepID=A0ABN0QN87_MYCUL|nr:hypothetical protein I551_7438 [Mycobacterium ulcerans str. Harvey]